MLIRAGEANDCTKNVRSNWRSQIWFAAGQNGACLLSDPDQKGDPWAPSPRLACLQNWEFILAKILSAKVWLKWIKVQGFLNWMGCDCANLILDNMPHLDICFQASITQRENC